MTLAVTIAFGVLFFLAIMACVALHELGHMLPAKLFGVKVPKYFVGFGRTLWSVKRGETEYGIKAFPLGGFVQLLGMYPPARPSTDPPSRLTRLADEARAAEWEDIRESDLAAGRLFYQQKTWKKLVMMAGGITMNLLVCFVLLWGVVGLHGVVRYTPVVGGVQQCIITVTREDMSSCQPGDTPTPAIQAGLVKGDRIVEFNGIAITSHEQLTTLIRDNLGGPAAIVVERDGVRTPLAPTRTVVLPRPDQLDPSKTVQAGFLGFVPVAALTKGGPAEVLTDMRTMTVQSLVALVQLPIKTFNVVADMVAGKPRDPNGPISVVGASTVAGEIAAAPDASVGDKLATFAGLLASVNLFLAIFNLVPLPPLDGGHILGALYEGVRRVLTPSRRQGDAAARSFYADTAKMLPVAYLVGGLVLVMGIVLIVADIVSPVKIF